MATHVSKNATQAQMQCQRQVHLTHPECAATLVSLAVLSKSVQHATWCSNTHVFGNAVKSAQHAGLCNKFTRNHK